MTNAVSNATLEFFDCMSTYAVDPSTARPATMSLGVLSGSSPSGASGISFDSPGVSTTLLRTKLISLTVTPSGTVKVKNTSVKKPPCLGTIMYCPRSASLKESISSTASLPTLKLLMLRGIPS